MGDFLNNIYKLLRRFPVGSSILLVALLGLLTYTVFQIKFEENITSLIPETEETQELQRILKATNFVDKILLDIHLEEGAHPDILESYAARLVDSLRHQIPTELAEVQGTITDEGISQTMDFVYNNLPLFLEKSDYDRIQSLMHPDSIDAITNRNYKTLLSPTGFLTKDRIRKDPLGMSYWVLQRFQNQRMGQDMTVKNGFLVSGDEEHLLLFINPKTAANDTAANEALVSTIKEILASLNREFEGKANALPYGAPIIAVENAHQIKSDIQKTVSIVAIALLVILISFYRKFFTPVVLFLPTIFGALVAISFLYVYRGTLSAISLGIGSVLLGITLDYSLHILTHLRNGEPPETVIREITKPILMSSLTTAVAFLCLVLLHSRALQDLGIFVAISVISASIFALILIPWLYRNTNNSIRQNSILDRIAAFPAHKNLWIVISLSILLIVSFFTYRKVSFNQDIATLNYESPDIQKAQEQLEGFTDITSKSMYVIAFGDAIETALQANDSADHKLQQLLKSGQIQSYSSAAGFVPSVATQNERISRWNSFWSESVRENMSTMLRNSGDNLGFRPTTHQAFYELLASDFHPQPLDAFREGLFLPIDDFVNQNSGLNTVSTVVKADEASYEALNESLSKIDNILVVDRKKINETFLGNLKNDFNRLIGYSLLLVFLLITVFFRRLTLAVVTAIPIALSWLLTIGLMGMFALEFNVFNIIISSFVFGLGIDYSIFVTQGLRRQYAIGGKYLATNKTAILLSVITTILGIGGLIFAKHPALHSIALISVLGIGSAVVVSFVMQPLLFTLFVGSTGKRPGNLLLRFHSGFSFLYFMGFGILFSISGKFIIQLLPFSKKKKMYWFHVLISKFMKSVLYTNPLVAKKVLNPYHQDFQKPAVYIANHSSSLDTLVMGMLHPKMIFVVNDWVYNSPVFGGIAKLADFYPISEGIDEGIEPLRKKIEQGYSLIIFPEGTRSLCNKLKRFHKGAFFISEKLELDIVPVLIHGNSEVLAKGDSMIRKGAITVKILKPINHADPSWGDGYAERTRKISRFFKQQFAEFRSEMEGPDYFHRMVLETYEYKDDRMFQFVAKDLKKYRKDYYEVLHTIGPKETVWSLRSDYGQLNLLLSLDSKDRKLYQEITDSYVYKLLHHARETKLGNMHWLEKHEIPLHLKIDTLILGTYRKKLGAIVEKHPEVKRVIVQKEALSEWAPILEAFSIKGKTPNGLVIFEK